MGKKTSMKKIVHFTNNLSDGGGRAVYALHKGFQEAGEESIVLCYKKTQDDHSIHQICGRFPTLPLSRYFKERYKIFEILRLYPISLWRSRVGTLQPLSLINFGLPFTTINAIRKHLENVDVVCFYSVQNLLSPHLIRKIIEMANVPVVWTILDNEPLSGGCHFYGECNKYRESCGNCPQLTFRGENDFSHRFWKEKFECLNDLPITFIAASNWVKRQIAASSLFGNHRIHKIMLGVDKAVFKCGDKVAARQALGLPSEAKIVLFGGFNLQDERKGGRYLIEALRWLKKDLQRKKQNLGNKLMLVMFGNPLNNLLPFDIPIEHRHLGRINNDNILVKAFQAADVFVSPSIDDLGPRVVIEAFQCGTPVVCFRLGVALDLIVNNEDGFIAEKFDSKGLAEGLLKCLLLKETTTKRKNSNKLRKTCQLEFQVKEYQKLFRKLAS